MRYLGELKALSLKKDDYAIFGSSVLSIRGLRENNDIDLLVKARLWEKLATNHRIDVLSSGSLVIHLPDHIEAFIDCPAFAEVETLINDADVFDDGIRFVKLESLCKWKRFRNMEKDRSDLLLIEAFLGAR